MRRLFLALFIASFAAPLAAEPEGGPRGPVEKIYSYYVDTADVGFQPTAAAARELFSARMNALLDHEEALAQADGIGNLDFDPFVNGQDFSIKALDLSTTRNGGATASVEARFLNFEAPNRIVYDLVVENDAWRIDDVYSPEGDYQWRLSDILSE